MYIYIYTCVIWNMCSTYIMEQVRTEKIFMLYLHLWVHPCRYICDLLRTTQSYETCMRVPFAYVHV